MAGSTVLRANPPITQIVSSMEPKRALVRDIGDRYKSCLSTHPLHSTLDLNLAREQHAAYCSALKETRA